MCYDIKTSLKAQLKRAKDNSDLVAIEEITERLAPLTDLPLHHASGFTHPELFIYTDRSPNFPEVATWGLIPFWVKDYESVKKLWNKTLNARGETIFDKPSFRDSAKDSRCVIYIDGFYEHHHFNGSAYPYFIYRKDKQPIALAGLYSEWKNQDTGGVINSFTIVTTKGNDLLAKIHNNPKLKEPRMPLILDQESESVWLSNIEEENINKVIKPFDNDQLTAHPVMRLRGKEYKGNIAEASDKVDYPELAFNEIDI